MCIKLSNFFSRISNYLRLLSAKSSMTVMKMIDHVLFITHRQIPLMIVKYEFQYKFVFESFHLQMTINIFLYTFYFNQ